MAPKIDGSAPENQNPKQHLEGSEFITVLRLPVVGLLEALRGTLSDAGFFAQGERSRPAQHRRTA